jgi:hypothetical protein
MKYTNTHCLDGLLEDSEDVLRINKPLCGATTDKLTLIQDG